ncbi:MAG: hypothetical protein LC725_12095 [Lentisphaerae bacterium]|nr:hypothetical protein [Lentisphaerota bacterium]
MTKQTLKNLCVIILLPGALAATNDLSAVNIVKDGKSNAQIVIAENPTRMQWMAAYELRDYVRKISGASTTGPTAWCPGRIGSPWSGTTRISSRSSRGRGITGMGRM